MHVERASVDDTVMVWEISELVMGGIDQRAQLMKAVENRQVYVAKAGFDVLGYAVRNDAFFGYSIVSQFAVHPEHRRQGVASALFAYMEKTNPLDRLFASTADDNIPAKLFLQALRYQRSGMVYHANPHGSTELIFVKLLV